MILPCCACLLVEECMKTGGKVKCLTGCEDGKPRTKGDLVRTMSDEELAEFMRGCPRNSAHNMCAGEGDDCKKCWLEWLKQEDDNA